MRPPKYTQNLNDTLTYGVLIITTTKSSSWLNLNTGVSILYGLPVHHKTTKICLVFLDVRPCNSSAILELFSTQVLTVQKTFLPSLPSDQRAQKWKAFSFILFFLLSVFYNGDIADNNCPHGKEKVWRQEGRKKDRLIAD